MSLTKKVYLTISGYDIKLSDNLTFYQKDQLKLIFYINEYGIDYENNATTRALMPVNPLNAILFIENPEGVDSVSSAKIEDNAVTFYLDSTHTQYVGISRMQLRLFDQDGCAITLPHFTFEIRENIYGSGDVRFQNVVMVDQTGTVILTEDNDMLDVGDILTIGPEVPYPQVTKTIKELPIKHGLDGTEKLIVEDNEATKQAPLTTIVDEIKQNSQEKIREIESELAQTNAQLSKKAHKDYVTPEDFGVTGTSDDRIVIQKAIDYALLNNVRLLLTKEYKIVPTMHIDGTYVGLIFDTPNSMRGYQIDFRKNARISTDYIDNDYDLIRLYGNNYIFNNMVLSGRTGSKVGTLLHLSRSNQDLKDSGSCQFNKFNNFYGENAEIALKCDGTVYYNSFDKFETNLCSTGILLTASKYMVDNNVVESNVNRNHFNEVVIKNANDGVKILYGDTNKFTNVSYEGVTNCTVVKSTTDTFFGGFSTDSNVFVDVVQETYTNAIINTASRTQVFGTNGEFNPVTSSVRPDVYIGSNLSSTIIHGMIIGGNKEAIDGFGGWQNFSLYSFLSNGLYDLDKDGDNYTRCLTNTDMLEIASEGDANATNYLSDRVYGKRIGNMVYLCGRAKITIPNSNGVVKLKIKDSWAYPNKALLTRTNVDVKHVIPITIFDGKIREVYGILTDDGVIEIQPPDNGYQFNDVRFIFNISYFGVGEYK